VEKVHNCARCGKTFYCLKDHTCSNIHGRGKNFLGPKDADIDESTFKLQKHSHRGSLLIYKYEVDEKLYLVADLFERIYRPLIKLLTQLTNFFSGIRVSLRLFCSLQEVKYGIEEPNIPVGSPFTILTHTNFIKSLLQNSVAYIIHSLNVFNQRGSEWVMNGLNSLEVSNYKF